MRGLVTVSSLAAILMVASVAYGGGSVWEFDGNHSPGDTVEATTAVAWSHDTGLGTPQDGPYLLYLAPIDVDTVSWPQPPEGSLLVGIVEVHEGPFTDDDGGPYGPHHAVARFEIPDVPAGRYQLFHCNDPCTTTLGDLVGGWGLRVVEGRDGRPAEDVAGDVQARVPTAPLLIAAEQSTQVTAVEGSAMPESSVVVEPVRADDLEQVSSAGPGVDHLGEPTAGQPPRFDSLWLLMVGVVALLLLVQMVRTQSQWCRWPDQKSGNEPASTDVLTDE